VGASCVGQPVDGETREPVGSSAEPIIGGRIDTADVAVVALLQPSTGTLCSGTLVAPTLVLTAAHCVYLIPASELQVLTGATVASPEQTIAVTSAVAYPTYDGEAEGLTGGVDLAVVTLATPLTVSPIAVNTSTTDKDLTGAEVTVVGFGLSDTGDPTTAGVRREVSLEVGSVCSRLLTAGGTDANACLGDSGGAVLLHGELIAVVSSGTPDCESPTNFTRTDAHAKWLAAAIAGNAAAACPACVPPDDACGAATETERAEPDASADDGGEAGDPSARDAATKGDARAPNDAGGTAGHTSGGCALAPDAELSSWVWGSVALLVYFASRSVRSSRVSGYPRAKPSA